jgi:2-methylcitrate dehydratase PrpD
VRAPDTPAARRLADFATAVEFESLPDAVRASLKLQLLDTLGVGLAAHALGAGTAPQEAMLDLVGAGRATAIGARHPLAVTGAALVNGTLFHALDYDDTHATSICHVSSVVCAAALASAEVAGVGGRELLSALAAGTEVAVRIGSISAVPVLERGFHPTSVFGVFGAAAAAARIARLSVSATTSALGIAGSLASGLFAYLADGTETKPLHAGFAAASGITAAGLARAGADGPPSVLEAPFGVFAAYGGVAVDPAAKLESLGTAWEVPNVALKPYPACHFMHASVYAAGQLAAAASLDPGEIEDVVVSIPPQAVAVVLEPAATKLAPRTPYEAKFSLQYSVAAMLANGRVDLSSYTEEAIGDRAVLELAQRVSYETKLYETYPAAFPGGVRIRTRHGAVLEDELVHQPGSAERPLADSEVREKFRRNARLALERPAVARLEEAVMALDTLADLEPVLEPLRRLGTAPPDALTRVAIAGTGSRST